VKLAIVLFVMSVIALLAALVTSSKYPPLAAESYRIETNLDDWLTELSGQPQTSETLQKAKTEITQLKAQQANVEVAQHRISSRSWRLFCVAIAFFAAGVFCVCRRRTAGNPTLQVAC